MNIFSNRKEEEVSPTMDVLTVTPDMARSWLDDDRRQNRAISASTVSKYARAMYNDEWELNGEAIKFNTKGILIDGQHRLRAIVSVNKPIELSVVRNLRPEVFLSLDQGRVRRAGDVASIEGFKNGSIISAGARICLDYASRQFNFKGKYDNGTIIQFIRDHPTIEEFSTGKRTSSHMFTPSIACGIRYLFYLASLDADMPVEFFDKIVTPSGLSANHPLFVLHTRLVNDSAGRSRMSVADKVLLIVKTWNKTLKGESLTKLVIAARMKNINGKSIKVGESFELILNTDGDYMQPESVLEPETGEQ